MTHSMIERTPQVMLGKPVIKGTRITVELVIRKLAEDFSIDDILQMYPHLNRKQVLAAIAFAADHLAHEILVEEVNG